MPNLINLASLTNSILTSFPSIFYIAWRFWCVVSALFHVSIPSDMMGVVRRQTQKMMMAWKQLSTSAARKKKILTHEKLHHFSHSIRLVSTHKSIQMIGFLRWKKEIFWYHELKNHQTSRLYKSMNIFILNFCLSLKAVRDNRNGNY